MSGSELVRRDTIDGWTGMLGPASRLATEIAQTEFVPAAMRGRPAAVTAAILFGRELGIGPMQALQSVHVIDGRPAVSAEMARALTLAAGHELHIEETTTTRCVVRGRRAGSREWTTVTWTADDAKRAQLDGHKAWRMHPRRMLQARATSELCHLLFSDAIGGMPFTSEELADDSDVQGPAKQPVRTARRSRRAIVEPSPPAAVDPPPPVSAEASPPLPGEDGFEEHEEGEAEETEEAEEAEEAPMATRAQVRAVQALYSGMGITDRRERLQTASAIVHSPLTSANDLTGVEAGVLIDTLRGLGEGPEGAERLRALVAETDEAVAEEAVREFGGAV